MNDNLIMGKFSFKNKNVLITGASGGLGSAMVKNLADWYSTAALVWPSFVDRRLARLRDQVIDKKSIKKRPWRLFQVESAIACNLKCIMCPWREMAKTAENRGVMMPAVWQAIRPYLDRVQSVDFTGGGEPLLQPKLAEWIREKDTDFLPAKRPRKFASYKSRSIKPGVWPRSLTSKRRHSPLRRRSWPSASRIHGILCLFAMTARWHLVSIWHWAGQRLSWETR